MGVGGHRRCGERECCDSSALLSGGVYNTNADIVLTTDGIFVVDTMGPPDATISIEAVEGQDT